MSKPSTKSPKQQRIALKTAEKTKDAVKLSYEHGTKLVGTAALAAGAGYQSTRVLASQHYERHWPTLEPHYNKHLNPVVQWFYNVKAREFDPRWKVTKQNALEFHDVNVDPHVKTAQKKYDEAFATASKHYAKHCFHIHKVIDDKAREFGLDFDREGGLGEAMEYSCEESELSMTWIQRVLLLLISWPLIRRAIRLVCRLVVMLWGIIVAVTPLQFVIRRGSTVAPEKGATANGSPGKSSKNKKKNGGKTALASQ